MGSRNVDPKTALRVVGSIACGSSLGGLVLIAEERRRRVAFAQRIIENGKRLQTYKSYHTTAPIETFDPSNFLDALLSELPPQQSDNEIRKKGRALPQSDVETQLSNSEWRSRKRDRSRMPTSHHATASRNSRQAELFEHWDLQPNRPTKLEGNELHSSVRSESLALEAIDSNKPGKLQVAETLPTTTFANQEYLDSNHTTTSEATKTRLHPSDSRNVDATPPWLSPNNDRQSQGAKYLEHLVAERVIDCINSGSFSWIRQGISELTAYFKDQRFVSTARMHEAVTLANGADFRKSEETRRVLADLRRICSSAKTPSSQVSSERHDTIRSIGQEGPFDQGASMLHMNQSLQAGQAQDAFYEFLTLCEKNTQPIRSAMRNTIQNIIHAFEHMGLFSVVTDIRCKCLFLLKETEFVLEDIESLISHTPAQNQPAMILKIFAFTSSIESSAKDRRRSVIAYNKCLKSFSHWDYLGAMIDMHLDYMQTASEDLKSRLWNSSQLLLGNAIGALMLNKAFKLANTAPSNSDFRQSCQLLVEQSLESSLSRGRLKNALNLCLLSLRHGSKLFELSSSSFYWKTIEQLTSTNFARGQRDLVLELLQSRYRLGSLEEVHKLSQRLSDIENLHPNLRAMVFHARYRHDAEKLLSELDRAQIPLSQTSASALALLLNVGDQRRAVNVFAELTQRKREMQTHDVILEYWRDHREILTAIDASSQVNACEIVAQQGGIAEAVDFVKCLPPELWTVYPGRVLACHKTLLSRCWTTLRNLELTKLLLQNMLASMGDSGDAVELYNYGILACVEAEDLAGAQTLADDMGRRLGLQPTLETWSHLILARAREGDWATVEEELGRLRAIDITSSQQTQSLDRIFVEHCRRHQPDIVYEFATHILDKFDLHVTYVVARTVLDVFVDGERGDLVRKWISFLEGKGSKAQFSRQAFTRMISRIAQNPKTKFDSILSQLSLRDVEDVVNPAKRADVLNQFSRTSFFLQTAGETPQKSEKAYEAVYSSSRDRKRQTERLMIDALAKRRPALALSIYSSALNNGLPSSSAALKLAIEAIQRLPKPQSVRDRHAQDLVSSARAAGFNVDEARLALRIQSLGLSENKISVSAVVDIFRQQEGLVLDRGVVLGLSQNLIKRGSFRGAFKVLTVAREQMQVAGRDFDVPMWTLLLRVLIRLVDVPGIQWAVDEILRLNLRIDKQLVQTLRLGRQAPRRTLRKSAEAGSPNREEPAEVIESERNGATYVGTEQELIDALDQAIARCRQRREEQRERSIHFAKEATLLMTEHHQRRRGTSIGVGATRLKL